MRTSDHDRALREHGAALIRHSRELRKQSKALRTDALRLLEAIGRARHAGRVRDQQALPDDSSAYTPLASLLEEPD